MAEDDMAVLPLPLRESARVEASGEVAWPLSEAPAVVNALANTGRVVLGLDLRRYDVDGMYELAWSAFNGSNPEQARESALTALDRDDMPTDMDWVLISW